MSVYVNNNFRVKRSADQQEAMKKLVDANIFDGYKDILMISAVIGYTQNRYVPIKKAASDGVLMQFFSQKDYDIMDLIAYGYKKEQSIIKQDEKYEIFSSFANGGFPLLLSHLEIDLNEPINEDDSRKAITRYYMLLISDGFQIKVQDSDLIM